MTRLWTISLRLSFTVKSCNDFLNTADAGSFFDLRKCMLNYLNVTSVHVHQGTFFFIVCLPSTKTGFHKSNRISKFGGISCVNFFVNSFSFRIIKLSLIPFLKFFLKIKNFMFKCEFVNLMLCFKGENLIICVLTEALSVVCLLIQFLNIFNCLVNLS